MTHPVLRAIRDVHVGGQNTLLSITVLLKGITFRLVTSIVRFLIILYLVSNTYVTTVSFIVKRLTPPVSSVDVYTEFCVLQPQHEIIRKCKMPVITVHFIHL